LTYSFNPADAWFDMANLSRGREILACQFGYMKQAQPKTVGCCRRDFKLF